MAYIGRSPVYGAFYKQTLTIDGSSTTYALDYTIASSNQILVVLGGVLQEPSSAYVVTGSGTQILFTETPSAGTSCYIVYLGETLTQARTAEVEPAYEEATGDGAEIDFTLTNGPVVLAGILVFVDGIQQTPTDNFTLIDGSTVRFTSAPAAGAQIDFYIKCVERTMFAAPTDGGVTSTKLADGAVTTAKIADGSITSDKIANGTVIAADVLDYTITSTKMANTGVTAATYGSSTQIPVVVVDAAGRITSASNTSLTLGYVATLDNVPQANVTNLTTDLSNITANVAAKASTGKAIAMAMVFGG